MIRLIRASKSPAEAREGLMTQFTLSLLQAQAILDMQLQRLTGLERQKILDELLELMKTIERLRAILSSDELLMQLVVDELKAVREKYGDERRTEIIDESGELRIEDLIADEDMAITVTETGYIKRTPITTYRMQRRGGKGRIGMRTREEDYRQPPLHRLDPHLHHDLHGSRPRLLAEGPRNPRRRPRRQGQGDRQPGAIEEGEKIAALLAVQECPEEEDQQFVVMGTRKGTIKKTDLTAFSNPRAERHHRDGRRRRRRGDRRGAVRRQGAGLPRHARRHGDPLRGDRRPPDGPHRLRRPRHHAARGRRSRGDGSRPRGGTVLTVAQNGYGKRTELDEYRLQSAAASASSTSRRPTATARSSASRTSTTTTS